MTSLPTTPLTILGGYLGAGKTTLINRLLAGQHGKRLTVLVNDFGAINIDADLIAEHSGETISLANGCACCQLQDDALKQLQDLAAMDDKPDHILVEASGAGEPARLAYLGYGIKGLSLAGVYVAVAADTLRQRVKDKFTGRLVQRQIAQADFCLLTKTDVAEDDGAAAQQVLQGLSDAPIAAPDDAILADMLNPAETDLPAAAAAAPLYADALFDSFFLYRGNAARYGRAQSRAARNAAHPRQRPHRHTSAASRRRPPHTGRRRNPRTANSLHRRKRRSGLGGA